AVELDLVHPVLASRRLRLQRRKLWLDEVGHWRLAGAADGWCRLFARLLLFLLDPAGLGRPARLLALDLGDLAPGLHRFRPLLENVRLVRRPRLVVIALDQQPVVALFPRPPGHADQVPAPGELFAFQLEFQMPLGETLVGV